MIMCHEFQSENSHKKNHILQIDEIPMLITMSSNKFIEN
jgi:hypothetical protein